MSYMNNIRTYGVYTYFINKLVSTDIYILTFMRLFKFYNMHVQHMLRETD